MAVQFQSNLRSVLKSLDASAKERIALACRHVQAEVKETLKGQRSGRVYRVKGRKREYTAAAPGEAPARQLGVLARSIRFRIIGGGLQDIQGVVGTNSYKANILEKGAKAAKKVQKHKATTKRLRNRGGNNGIAPRPFFAKTFNKSLDKVAEIVGKDWQK